MMTINKAMHVLEKYFNPIVKLSMRNNGQGTIYSFISLIEL